MFDAIAVLVIFVLLGTGIGIIIGVKLERMEQRKRITDNVIDAITAAHQYADKYIDSLKDGEIEINGNYWEGD